VSADVSDAPGSVALVTLMSAKATDRAMRSTCAVAVASSVPNVSLPTVLRHATALRKAIALPSQRTTCGG